MPSEFGVSSQGARGYFSPQDARGATKGARSTGLAIVNMKIETRTWASIEHNRMARAFETAILK